MQRMPPRTGPDEILGLLAELPLTAKDELRLSQESAPPFGDYLSCNAADVIRIHRTSGTTGRPLIIALTARDALDTRRHGAQAFWCAGLRTDDIVVHCLNYQMWAGGLTDHLSLEETGAAVIPFGVGNTTMLVRLPEWVPFTAVSCTPSYVSLLLEMVPSGAPTKRWAENVRLFLVGGEPGASNPALREAVASRFGARIVNANYGLAEVLSMFGSQCEVSDALHFHGYGNLWIELLDVQTGRPLPIEPGSAGEVVATHLRRQAQPLVRYRTNDVIEVIATHACACGRGSFRFRIRSRVDDMFVVRGVNVFPSAIADLLGRLSPAVTEFLVRLPATETFDSVPLEVEAPRLTADPNALVELIERTVKETLGVTAHVAVVPHGTLQRSEGKTVRVIRHGKEST